MVTIIILLDFQPKVIILVLFENNKIPPKSSLRIILKYILTFVLIKKENTWRSVFVVGHNIVYKQ